MNWWTSPTRKLTSLAYHSLCMCVHSPPRIYNENKIFPSHFPLLICFTKVLLQRVPSAPDEVYQHHCHPLVALIFPSITCTNLSYSSLSPIIAQVVCIAPYLMWLCIFNLWNNGCSPSHLAIISHLQHCWPLLDTILTPPCPWSVLAIVQKKCIKHLQPAGP